MMIVALRKVTKRMHHPLGVRLTCVRWYATYRPRAPRSYGGALTGDFGSSSRAIKSRTWAGDNTPAWPKRGMPEQAL